MKKNRQIATPLTDHSGYVIPRYDFDKLDDLEKIVDVEQVRKMLDCGRILFDHLDKCENYFK